eukprot:4646688-Pleurochrysis_carterae.AAC.1
MSNASTKHVANALQKYILLIRPRTHRHQESQHRALDSLKRVASLATQSVRIFRYQEPQD